MKHYIEDLEVDVRWSFQPEEPMVRYYPDGSGHPGCAASVYDIEITAKINGVNVDITNLLEQLGYHVEDIAWELQERYD